MRSHLRRLEGASGARLPVVLLVPAVAVSVAALIPLVYVVFITVQTGLVDGRRADRSGRGSSSSSPTPWRCSCSRSRPASRWASVPPGWSSERTCPDVAPGPSCSRPRSSSRPSSTSYGWITIFPSLAGSGRRASWSRRSSYFPLIYLPVVATLRRLDPALEEVAAQPGSQPAPGLPRRRRSRSCGCRSSVAALLVGLHLLAEYGAFAMLRFDTFTTAIIQQYRSTFNGPAAASLASVLVALLPRAAAVRERRARRRARTRGSGPARPGRSVGSGSGGCACRPCSATGRAGRAGRRRADAQRRPLARDRRASTSGPTPTSCRRWSRPRRWPPVARSWPWSCRCRWRCSWSASRRGPAGRSRRPTT